MPSSRPAFVMRRSPSLRTQPVHSVSSFLRRLVGWKFTPQAGALGSKLRVRNGISISIVHPISLLRVLAYQIPSQARAELLLLLLPSAVSSSRLSPMAPLGF